MPKALRRNLMVRGNSNELSFSFAGVNGIRNGTEMELPMFKEGTVLLEATIFRG